MQLVDERLIEFLYKINAPNNPWLYVPDTGMRWRLSTVSFYDLKQEDKDDVGIVYRYMVWKNDDTCVFKVCIKVLRSLTIWYNVLLISAVVLIVRLLLLDWGSHEIVPVTLADVVVAFIAT